METMKALVRSWLVVGVSLGTAVSAGGQTPVGALAIDERQDDQYGWAVDYETAAAARAAALRECGSGCSVVLTFDRCGAYAADQDANSTAVGWAESYDSAASARQAALSECSSRGGSECAVRVWGCNGPVAEEGLGLDQAARRADPVGPADGGLQLWWRGRSLRSADACGDSELAIGARGTDDRVSGRPASRRVARQERVPASGLGGCRGSRFRGTGSRVLAEGNENGYRATCKTLGVAARLSPPILRGEHPLFWISTVCSGREGPAASQETETKGIDVFSTERRDTGG